MRRSKTRAVVHFSETRSAPNIGVYASQNMLTSALFEIRNLTVLTLRNNRLNSLPAAIGELRNLKELNISNNRIRYLPSTILGLALEIFSAHPNRWLEPSDPGDDEMPPTAGAAEAGTATSNAAFQPEGSVPRLTTLCLMKLLSPGIPSNLPPLVDCYDWDNCKERDHHPLLDLDLLQNIMPPSLSTNDVARILQAVKSACTADPGSTRSSAGRDRFPRSHRVPPPDNASANPYYQPCPSPRHRTGKRIFLHAAERKYEWREVARVSNLPVLWIGCSPGCLAFLGMDLEEEDSDGDGDWPVDIDVDA